MDWRLDMSISRRIQSIEKGMGIRWESTGVVVDIDIQF